MDVYVVCVHSKTIGLQLTGAMSFRDISSEECFSFRPTMGTGSLKNLLNVRTG